LILISNQFSGDFDDFNSKENHAIIMNGMRYLERPTPSSWRGGAVTWLGLNTTSTASTIGNLAHYDVLITAPNEWNDRAK